MIKGNTRVEYLSPKTAAARLTNTLRARGFKIRQWRVGQGYTAKQLAALLNVHPNTVANIEAGAAFRSDIKERLAKLGFPPHLLRLDLYDHSAGLAAQIAIHKHASVAVH